MSRTVPEGWSVQSLDGKIEILSGFPFKSAQFTDDKSKIGLIRIRDLAKQRVETFYDGEFDDQYVVTKGDVLIGMDGDFNIVKWKSKEALLNQRICMVRASEGKDFDTEFLFHSLEPELQDIHASTGATTVRHLSVKNIRGIQKAYPPLPEQQKIATILSSVDDVIEKTTAQIRKLKDLKTGMMQELLTKGIGHTEFKDSPVGRIPVGWDCVKMNSIAKVNDGAHHTPTYTPSGVPFLRVTDMKNKDVFEGSIKYISEEEHQELIKRCKPEKGDILYSKNGTIGIVRLVDWDQEFSIFVSLALIKIQSQQVLSRYLALFMDSPIVREQIRVRSKQGTVTNLHLEEMRDFDIPLPDFDEQERISNALLAVADRLALENHKLRTNQNIKKALMQDLLTGKVRVSVS